MEKRTKGTVLSVKTQWWLKVNTKAVRLGPLDGATFPHIVKVKYTVDGNEIIKNKWLGAGIEPPSVNGSVIVVYREDKPTKFRLEI
ncbi:MAG: sugar ABC transporter permease [Clostridia bacterium]|nr:sugar ABC transporter permease [Clostridia bacterium]